MEREVGQLRAQHHLLHLRRHPAGDEACQGVPGHVRQGGRLQEPGKCRLIPLSSSFNTRAAEQEFFFISKHCSQANVALPTKHVSDLHA